MAALVAQSCQLRKCVNKSKIEGLRIKKVVYCRLIFAVTPGVTPTPELLLVAF
jgi:hypothetical protein